MIVVTWKPDPGSEAVARVAKLAELECRRDKIQGMFAAEAMAPDELEARLEVLKETRETSEKELAALAGRGGRLQEIEQDRDLILESYATFAPEASEAFSPEEHR